MTRSEQKQLEDATDPKTYPNYRLCEKPASQSQIQHITIKQGLSQEGKNNLTLENRKVGYHINRLKKNTSTYEEKHLIKFNKIFLKNSEQNGNKSKQLYVASYLPTFHRKKQNKTKQ